MVSKVTTGFRKNEDCPSSQDLLSYQNGRLGQHRAARIREHLFVCEFCEAEVEFYCHFPQEDPGVEASAQAKIPPPLFELAEALLKRRHADAKSLNSLLQLASE